MAPRPKEDGVRFRTLAFAVALAVASTAEARGQEQNGTTTALRLIGTVANHDSSGVAILQRSDGAIQFIERGGEIEGYTITAILQASVVLRRAEEELVLELRPGGDPTANAPITLECPPGGRAGAVWGTDVYTSDSSVCTAAAHAGKITLERGGTVRYVMVAGRPSYVGSQRNGVTSANWGEYPSSFRFP